MPRKEYNERGTATQPVLPIFDVPKVVRAHGLRDAHSRPLAAAGKGRGGFRTRRVSTADAWLHFASIEVRTGNSYPAILLDCDGREGTASLVEALAAHMMPAPNWTVYRASSGGTHAAWCLSVPVHRGALARAKPLRMLGRVSEWMAHACGADPTYTAVLTHNPYKPAQDSSLNTKWGRRDPYSLQELAAPIPRYWRKPALPATAPGRNCAMFDACMKWAGSPANLGCPVIDVARELNAEFEQPLPMAEIWPLAKSVERYRREWKSQGRFYSAAEREAYARQCGIASGVSRRSRTAQRDAEIVRAWAAGASLRKLAAVFGMRKSGVDYIVRRDSAQGDLLMRNTNELHR